MTCPRCRLPYSDDVPLNPVIGGEVTAPICGCCALAIVNEIHGTRMKAFHGELAEDARQAALEWRRANPKIVSAVLS